MKHFGLIGYKLGHSYSKTIHEFNFKKLGLDADYSLIEVNEEDLGEVCQKLRSGLLDGINVTIPYKEKIIPYLDFLSSDVNEIKACNTVKVLNGKLYGYNTDYIGFIKQLDYQHIDVKNKNVYVLGSGGASKAICYALDKLAAKVTVVSRRGPFKYEDLYKLKSIDVIVNATPVGMWPDVDASPLSREILSKVKVVVDIIFNPRQTKLLQLVNQTNNGLPMLIYQAIASEEIWLDRSVDADIEEIKEAIG